MNSVHRYRKCKNLYLRAYWYLCLFDIPHQKYPGKLVLSMLKYRNCTSLLLYEPYFILMFYVYLQEKNVGRRSEWSNGSKEEEERNQGNIWRLQCVVNSVQSELSAEWTQCVVNSVQSELSARWTQCVVNSVRGELIAKWTQCVVNSELKEKNGQLVSVTAYLDHHYYIIVYIKYIYYYYGCWDKFV